MRVKTGTQLGVEREREHVVRCYCRCAVFVGAKRASWTLSAIYRLSLHGLDGFKWSGWYPDSCETGLDCSQSVQTALKWAGGFKSVLNIYTLFHCNYML